MRITMRLASKAVFSEIFDPNYGEELMNITANAVGISPGIRNIPPVSDFFFRKFPRTIHLRTPSNFRDLDQTTFRPLLYRWIVRTASQRSSFCWLFLLRRYPESQVLQQLYKYFSFHSIQISIPYMPLSIWCPSFERDRPRRRSKSRLNDPFCPFLSCPGIFYLTTRCGHCEYVMGNMWSNFDVRLNLSFNWSTMNSVGESTNLSAEVRRKRC